MKPHLYIPQNLKIRKIIACMGYVSSNSAHSIGRWLGLIPNGTTNITLSLGNDPIRYHNQAGYAVVYPNYMSPVLLKSHRSLSFINIQIMPFGLRCLTNSSMEEMSSKALTMEMLFKPSECERLMNQISDSKDIQEKFKTVEQFLADKVDLDIIDDRVLWAYSILKEDSLISIDMLSEKVSMSNRRLHKLFKSQTGNSPSLLKKIQRLNNSIKQISLDSDRSLTDIAYTNGYFDQSHFIKDFKQFTGITPSYFKKSKSKSSDFYNFLLNEPDRFGSE